MPGPNLIQSLGGQAQKPARFTSIFTSRFFLGLFTNRNLLRGPLNLILSDFYHAGTTDVLCDGSNTELYIQLTMVRRPGNPKFSSATVVGSPDTFYSFHRSDGAIQTIVDTENTVQYLTSSVNTSIFTKATGAGEGYFQGVLNTLYMADGVDLLQYTPTGNTNPSTGTKVWNWGGPAPTNAPSITVLASGFNNPAWAASTWYSTMGIIRATPTGGAATLYQLSSVNSDPSNPNSTQIGVSGNGQPNFSTSPGGQTVDGSVTWYCSTSAVQLWKPKTFYNQYNVIWDPGTNGIYFASHNFPIQSASAPPNFNHTIIGSATTETSGMRWRYLGTPGGTCPLWKKSTAYTAFPFADDATLTVTTAVIVEPVIPTVANMASGNPPIYIQFCRVAGTSASSFTQPNFPATPRFVVSADGQLSWTCLGLSAYPSVGTTLVPWAPGQPTFSAYVDSNSNIQVCIAAGTAAASAPVTPLPNYGDITADGLTALWSNCGPVTNAQWRAASNYYLPIAGFAPPLAAIKFGGAAITDTNNNQEFVSQSGFSGNAAPAWSTTVGGTTTDNTGGGTAVGVVWVENGAVLTNSLTWSSGYAYAYSFKSRTAGDVYSFGTTVPANLRQLPPLQTNYLPAPSGALTGDVTTASPIQILNSPNLTGGIIQLSGLGTLDPQYDTIEIYRSVNGGQQGTVLLFLTDIPMPLPSGGVPGTWTFQDYMPDLATSTVLVGLNPLVTAPIAHQNDPPPGQTGSTVTSSGLIGLVYHQGRLWGFVGSTVYASGGPDTNPGNGFDAWPPTNNFPFQSLIVKLLPTAAGLLVFTTTDLYFIGGGPAIGSYYSQLFVPGLGVSSPNAVTMVKGLPYIFASDRQLLAIDPSSGGITRVGHPIGDKLDQFNPANVYLTYHSYGDRDHAIFIGDGATGWYRCDPSLAPDSDTTGPVWSPFATVNGGHCKAIVSVETSPGVHQLLVGDDRDDQYVLTRDSNFAVFTDGGAVSTGSGGTAYDAYFTMGNVVLCSPGQMAEMAFIEMDFTQVGSQPTVSILFDELSATNGAAFEIISGSFVSDPPKKYGLTATPKTMWSNRYYFGQTTVANTYQQPLPAWCKSFQLKVDFGSDVVMNQALSMCVFGALYQEK